MNIKKYLLSVSLISSLFFLTTNANASLFESSNKDSKVIEEKNSEKSNYSTEQFGSINIQQIDEFCKVFANIKKQMEGRAKEMRDKFDLLQETLIKEQKSLQTSQKTLSADAYSKSAAELTRKMQERQAELHEDRQILEKDYFNAISHVNKVLMSVVSEYAEKNGYTAVFEKSTLVYNKFKDVTEPLVKLIDEKISHYKIDFSQKENKNK